MTDVTSPVAKLSAKLPKGNGFSRAVPDLYERRGDIVFFVGAMRIEETSLDLNDTEKVLGTIQRFELAQGPAVADVRDLLTICSTAATSHDGQQSLFVEHTQEDDEERRSLIRDLLEWGSEQTPALDVDGVTDLWNSWHGGNYDARLDSPKTPVKYLREFAIYKEVIAEEPLTPAFSDVDSDQDSDQDPDGDDTADES